MFTGIVEAVGTIASIQPCAEKGHGGLSLAISTQQLDLSDVAPGDSIAVNGVCLTVTALTHDSFAVDVSGETLNCTVGLDQPEAHVNLEKAMRLSDRLGGHLVSGHVDAVGVVAKVEHIGECVELIIQAPSSIIRYLAHKGSITVNGVSLTINKIAGNEFAINLIPHTLAMTNLQALSPEMRVNLETDMLARYVARLLNLEDSRD
ncbi:MAG: riboflavin synthase [Betaproteobacteria bacterium]|nr:riboflavin synthase [Betaproteobacteria bacterium]